MDNIPADLRRQIDCCRSLKFQSDENLIINYYGDNRNLMRYKLECISSEQQNCLFNNERSAVMFTL